MYKAKRAALSPKVKRRVGKYELGRTIGEGAFAKVRFAKNTETGEPVAIKILDKEKVQKHRLVDQIRREICTMKLIKHPNVVRQYELENLLLDAGGNLKVSDFGLSALKEQVKADGLLHTTCGTPNYVAPEVIEDGGYDGATADVWSCGVILFILLAGYLPFEDDNIIALYKKISEAQFSCPSWISAGAKNLITRILDPNPTTRITIAQILEHPWFKKGYKPPIFEEKYQTTLDDVDAAFGDSEDQHVKEETEDQPTSMNAFELISLNQALNLDNLFEAKKEYRRETRFTSQCPPKEIITKIEEAAKPLGFDVQKKKYKMRMENPKAGRKGNLNVATEVFQIAPSLHVVEVKKAKGDTLEFQKFYRSLSTQLKDVVWKCDGEVDGNSAAA
ncbi:hypothetical protein PR202_ga25914 [Eleusine coracana subsp. coracana]|uniref:non-specific serine/threonine protein kinase n=1 Tax=Eleusine coracana subsp. coracana TaxID=191504 RepID=A0AAV5DCK6_ELECO|nr:hypothetical protein PR202_ga25914 [Eleusine coracana subsp. coracana]